MQISQQGTHTIFTQTHLNKYRPFTVVAVSLINQFRPSPFASSNDGLNNNFVATIATTAATHHSIADSRGLVASPSFRVGCPRCCFRNHDQSSHILECDFLTIDLAEERLQDRVDFNTTTGSEVGDGRVFHHEGEIGGAQACESTNVGLTKRKTENVAADRKIKYSPIGYGEQV